jgi:autotransporter translocation and assembly factor TamB
VDAHGGLGGGTPLEATAGGGVWSRPQPVPLGPASLRARVSPLLDLDVESFDGGTARSRLRGTGRIETADRGALDLAWNGALDLHELAGFATRPTEAAGAVSVDGTVKGTLDAPAVAGQANGEALRLADLQVDRADARFTYDLAGSSAAWTARALGGSLTGDATLKDARIRVRAKGEGIDTRRLPPSAMPQGLPPSRVSGQVDAEGPLDGPLQVAFDLRGSGAQDGVSHQVSAQGRGRVETGETRVGLDWTAQLALSHPLAEGAVGWHAARLQARGDARGALPPDVTGTLAGTVALQTATGPQEVAVEGQVHTKGANVAASATARGLGGSGQIELSSDGRVIRDLRAHAQGLDVSPFAAGARGTVDADLQAAGPLDRLSGSGTLRAPGSRAGRRRRRGDDRPHRLGGAGARAPSRCRR